MTAPRTAPLTSICSTELTEEAPSLTVAGRALPKRLGNVLEQTLKGERLTPEPRVARRCISGAFVIAAHQQHRDVAEDRCLGRRTERAHVRFHVAATTHVLPGPTSITVSRFRLT